MERLFLYFKKVKHLESAINNRISFFDISKHLSGGTQERPYRTIDGIGLNPAPRSVDGIALENE